MQCLIVEDEPMARKGISEDLRDIPFIEIAGVAENAMQAMELLGKLPVDLVFLDIEMPKFNGLDLVKSLKTPPMVIVTTAYPQYAMQGYDLDVLDYLLKPIPYSRLLKACQKARDLFLLKKQPFAPSDQEGRYFFIKSSGKLEKIFLHDLLFAEAADNYVMLHTLTKQYLTYSTLHAIESNLPAELFIQVHKSFIIAISKINRVEKNRVIMGKYQIPVSRNYKENFTARVLLGKMLRR
jgi:DNA-binding LytR/AlgR family response regulator